MNSPNELANELVSKSEPPTLVNVKEIKDEIPSAYGLSSALPVPNNFREMSLLNHPAGTAGELGRDSDLMSSQEASLVGDMFTSTSSSHHHHHHHHLPPYTDNIFQHPIELELHSKPPLLLPDLSNDNILLDDPLKEIKESVGEDLQGELWINNDPYDIDNIAPTPKMPMDSKIPLDTVPTIAPVDILPHLSVPCKSELSMERCVEEDVTMDVSFPSHCVIADKDKEIPTKLLIRIPLQGIQLKNTHCINNRTNRSSSSASCSNLDSSLSDSYEIDVVNDQSPLKRKRKLTNTDTTTTAAAIATTATGSCASNVMRRLDMGGQDEGMPASLEDLRRDLVVRIDLAKLRRIPSKGTLFNDCTSKDKGRPPKISKIHPPELSVACNPENALNCSTDPLLSPLASSPPYNHNFNNNNNNKNCDNVNKNNNNSSNCDKTRTRENDMNSTEHSHQNDVSEETPVTAPHTMDTRKRRGAANGRCSAPQVEVSKPKVEPKAKLLEKDEVPLFEPCDDIDSDVCHECGTLRKDYGRDSGRINSYRTAYSHYFTSARESKHKADNLKVPIERAHKYTEAVLKYIEYLIGMEVNGMSKLVPKGVDEYTTIIQQSIQLVDYVIKNYGRKDNSCKTPYDARFLVLCLRLQSLLYLKLFKVKKDSAMKYTKVLASYFKNYAKEANKPTPYPKPGPQGSTGTPSPGTGTPSPGPSPGGSIASMGSAGSSSGSFVGADSVAAGYVTIPIDLHEKANHHLHYSRHLMDGHCLWDESDSLVGECQAFVTQLSKKAGVLTMQSSLMHVVDYVTAGLELIKEKPLSQLK